LEKGGRERVKKGGSEGGGQRRGERNGRRETAERAKKIERKRLQLIFYTVDE
jgi:hypothetical protein